MAQFPSPVVNIVAKFVSYVIGSFAACALFCAVVDDRLLQAYIGDRDLLWVTAVLGTILASSRALMATENAVFEPNAVMSKIVSHTHYLPKHWRDAAHKEDVQGEFNAFFSLKSAMFLEEIASVFAAPFVLWFPLCDSADDIIQFVRQFTTNKSGVGDICSLSAFDFNRHGNKNYGAPSHAEKSNRSRQGKMEKSFLTFQATYPTWEPDTSGRNMLNSLNGFSNTNENALGKSADLSASVLKRSFHNLKDAPTSSKGDVRRRFDRGSSHRPPAHGSGSMFHPSFISDTQELHALSETLSASQTVLQHFYEEQMEDTTRDDTAARTSPTRDDAMSEHENVEVPTIDQIQMYQRPPPSVTPLTTFPEEIPLVRAQNGAPSVLDSCVLPTSTVLPAIERDDNILDL